MMEKHPQDAPVIAVEHLGVSVQPHFWSRAKTLLQDVHFNVARGQIFGFVGPNGAGKTTTIKCILGLWRPQKGCVRINGMPVTMPAARRRLGFLPERAYFPDQLTATELVVQHGRLAGLPKRAARTQAQNVLQQVGLEHVAQHRLGTFSKGMLQRAGLAQALVGDPELLVLDEPMSGLDPIGRRDVREVMLAARQAGKTIFFSSHILPDVELICDQVAILSAGTVRHIGQLHELYARDTGGVEVVAHGVSELAMQAAKPLVTHNRRHGPSTSFQVASLTQANELIDCLRQHHAIIATVMTARVSLEEVFMNAATTTHHQVLP